MEYRDLGRTELRVSRLSFGASSLGSVFREVDEGEGVRAVHAALDLGINLIDVSPYYGLTRAETVLGRALRGVPRERYLLATKVGRYGDDEFDFSASRTKASVDESLGRLGVDHVDLIQGHDIEFGDLDQVVQETIPALREIQEVGKARFVGITGLPLRIFENVVDRVAVDTVLSYCHGSLNDASLLYLLPFLRDKGVGVISASPLSMGLLAHQGPPAWHPAPASIQEACRQAATWCAGQGLNLAKLALQYALSLPGVDTVLVGTASADNIERNVRWMDEPLDEGAVAAVQRILEPVRDTTWIVGRAENTGDIRGHPVRVASD